MIDELCAGRCGCGGPLHHGPWTDEQIAEACADIGCEPEDFGDYCDSCFIRWVAGDDAAYAEKLAGRPLRTLCPGSQATRTSSSRPSTRAACSSWSSREA